MSEYKVDDHPIRDALISIVTTPEYEREDDGLFGVLFGRRKKK